MGAVVVGADTGFGVGGGVWCTGRVVWWTFTGGFVWCFGFGFVFECVFAGAGAVVVVVETVVVVVATVVGVRVVVGGGGLVVGVGGDVVVVGGPVTVKVGPPPCPPVGDGFIGAQLAEPDGAARPGTYVVMTEPLAWKDTGSGCEPELS